jgi:hypothetical protein
LLVTPLEPATEKAGGVLFSPAGANLKLAFPDPNRR